MMQPVADAHDRAVRWRQLVDLLSRPHGEIDPALLDAAYAIVRSGPDTVPVAVRSATARSIAGREMAPALFAIFAADRLDVAAPLLASAKLDAEGWTTVARAASAEVQPLVRSLRGETAPARPLLPAPTPVPTAPPPEDPREPSISEMVERIQRLRRERQADAEPPASFADDAAPAPPPLPPGGRLFRWECDASGQIDWVEGVPRGALIGRNLTIDAEQDRKLRRALTERAPFDGAALALDVPAIPARWRLSGIPAFSPVDGRFLGYRGIASAEAAEEAPAEPVPDNAAATLGDDAEALRETIHEIKTPLNAIIGFAEIIDGQYLGPAHRSYRRRAAEIVTQARVLLGAIEDLDFAARMRSPGGAGSGSTRLVDVMPALVEGLQRKAAAASVELLSARMDGSATVLLADDLVERLLRRFLGAAVDAARDGERIEIGVERERDRVAVRITRPATTIGLGEGQLLDPAFGADGEGEAAGLGLGFALRLVRGLARLAGGDLAITPDALSLQLPPA